MIHPHFIYPGLGPVHITIPTIPVTAWNERGGTPSASCPFALKRLHLYKRRFMPKIQVQAEVDVKSLLAQMDTDELEGLVREASALLTQRKSDSGKSQITQLLQRLNEECALPEAHWEAFHFLSQKEQRRVCRKQNKRNWML